MDAAEMLPRIAVAPGGQSGSWGDFAKAFETPVEDLLTIIPKDIDPQGLFKALLAPQYLQGPPAPQREVVPEPVDDMVHVVTHAHGPIERLYEAEFLRLEAGLEEGMEHVDALQLHINPLGTDMNTATLGPFIVATPGITGTAGPTLSNTNLVVSTLEPIHEQERTSSGESPGGYRANLEHSSYSESFNAASSSSDSPQH